MQAQWKGRTIYTGSDYSGRYCITDDRDALPPDLVTFHELQWQGVNTDGSPMLTHADEIASLGAAIRQTEATGVPVIAQIGDFYHES